MIRLEQQPVSTLALKKIKTNLEHLAELSKCACLLGLLSLLASIQLYVGGPPRQCMYSTIHNASVYCTFSFVFGMELSNRLANIRRLSLGQPACKTQRKDKLSYGKFQCVPPEGSQALSLSNTLLWPKR